MLVVRIIKPYVMYSNHFDFQHNYHWTIRPLNMLNYWIKN